jgi:outer membrane receptor protein involved in Fe transport
MWFDAADDGTSATEVRPTGNLGVELPVGPVIVASHGGFVARPPSFVERYGNRGAFIGDPSLRPESAFTADAGARITRRLGPVRLHAEAAGFATWADDLITFVYAGANGRAKATNIGQARMLGVEGAVRAAAFGVEARASYTGLDTANESACRYEGTRCIRPPLPGRPMHDFVADVSWTHGPVRLRYGVDLVAGMLADVTEQVEVPLRVFHGAGARLAVPKVRGLSLTFDVRNLFDLRVVDYVGALGPVRAPVGDLFDYPLPGRRVLLSARWTTDAGQ